MRYYIQLIVIAFTCLLVNLNCTRQPLTENEIIEKLETLEGLWQQQPNENNYEQWSKSEDLLMQGRLISINQQDTTVNELFTIGQDNNQFYYVATVFNQNEGKPIGFQLTEWTDKRFRFENAEHDFPNLIEYTFRGEDVYEVWLRGDINGLEKNTTLKFKKVK